MANAKHRFLGVITAILIVMVGLGSAAFATPMAMDASHCKTRSVCMAMSDPQKQTADNTAHEHASCTAFCCVVIAVFDAKLPSHRRMSQLVIHYPAPFYTMRRAESLHRPPNV